MPLPSAIFQPQQLEFQSLTPTDRTVLYVSEVAKNWRCTEQHVLDLLQEGKLIGFDIAGQHEYIRLPKCVIAVLAKKFHVPEGEILSIVEACKPDRSMTRSSWRIPVKEGFLPFMRENHSLNLKI